MSVSDDRHTAPSCTHQEDSERVYRGGAIQLTSPPLAQAASDDRSGSQTSERIAALERRIAVGDAASKQTQDALREALKEKDRR